MWREIQINNINVKTNLNMGKILIMLALLRQTKEYRHLQKTCVASRAIHEWLAVGAPYNRI